MPISNTAVNLNADTPAAPTDASNIIFQSDGGFPMNSYSAFDPLMVRGTSSGGQSGLLLVSQLKRLDAMRKTNHNIRGT